MTTPIETLVTKKLLAHEEQRVKLHPSEQKRWAIPSNAVAAAFARAVGVL